MRVSVLQGDELEKHINGARIGNGKQQIARNGQELDFTSNLVFYPCTNLCLGGEGEFYHPGSEKTLVLISGIAMITNDELLKPTRF